MQFLRGLKYWIIGNILLELDFNSAVCNNQIQQCVNWLNAILWENLFRFDTPACGKWPSLFVNFVSQKVYPAYIR